MPMFLTLVGLTSLISWQLRAGGQQLQQQITGSDQNGESINMIAEMKSFHSGPTTATTKSINATAATATAQRSSTARAAHPRISPVVRLAFSSFERKYQKRLRATMPLGANTFMRKMVGWSSLSLGARRPATWYWRITIAAGVNEGRLLNNAHGDPAFYGVCVPPLLLLRRRRGRKRACTRRRRWRGLRCGRQCSAAADAEFLFPICVCA
jgi:hypothetical protein